MDNCGIQGIKVQLRLGRGHGELRMRLAYVLAHIRIGTAQKHDGPLESWQLTSSNGSKHS
jgi:hypothetical protein